MLLTKRLQRLGYCLSFAAAFFYLMFVLFVHKIKTSTPSSIDETGRSAPCNPEISIKHDASKNHLLTFYGHDELLDRPDVFTPRREILTPLNYSFIIGSSDACPAKSKSTLMIMVLTQHGQVLQRQAIRETWGSVAKTQTWPGRRLHGEVRLIFLLGKSDDDDLNARLAVEAVTTRDIVQADFAESYFNLTLKVLMGLQWVKTFCPNTKYIMKTDEDSFMDIPRLLNILATMDLTDTIYGPFAWAELVNREKNFKGSVAMSAYPLHRYPPHVKGNMYVIPMPLAIKIANVSQYFPYVNIEDVHITGILAKVFKARHVNIPEELYIRHHKEDISLCDFVLERKLLSQGVYPELAYQFWKRIQDSRLCGVITVDSIVRDFSGNEEIIRNNTIRLNSDSRRGHNDGDYDRKKTNTKSNSNDRNENRYNNNGIKTNTINNDNNRYILDNNGIKTNNNNNNNDNNNNDRNRNRYIIDKNDSKNK